MHDGVPAVHVGKGGCVPVLVLVAVPKGQVPVGEIVLVGLIVRVAENERVAVGGWIVGVSVTLKTNVSVG